MWWDVYWFVQGCFDSNHLKFSVNADFVLGYVFPFQDQDTSRGSVSIFVYVIVLFVVSDVELIGVFEECLC